MDVRKGPNLNLTVLERLLLLRVLPKQGNLTTLRIVRELERDLSFSEEEHAALQFVTEGVSVRWKAENAIDKEVEFGPKARELVLAGLAELDKQEALTLDWLDLCDKFGYVGDDATD